MGIQLRTAGIINESIVDGPGIRMVIFTQGCLHNCPGCHNQHTHSFDAGELIDTDKIITGIKNNPLLDGITFSGGDPFEQAAACAVLAGEVKKLGLNVVTYTGYTYEELIGHIPQNPGIAELLENTDILIDGPFILKEKDLLLKFRGSANQRIIDMNRTRKEGAVILAEL